MEGLEIKSTKTLRCTEGTIKLSGVLHVPASTCWQQRCTKVISSSKTSCQPCHKTNKLHRPCTSISCILNHKTNHNSQFPPAQALYINKLHFDSMANYIRMTGNEFIKKPSVLLLQQQLENAPLDHKLYPHEWLPPVYLLRKLRYAFIIPCWYNQNKKKIKAVVD